MQRSQKRSLNDTMWSAVFNAPQDAIATIIPGFKGSLEIIIGLRDMSTIMPL
jgi:hypothetical protein